MAFKLLAAILIFSLYPTTPESHTQWHLRRPPPLNLPLPLPENPKPLCISQFALVNRACRNLPFSSSVPTPTPPAPPAPPAPPSPEDDGVESGHHRHHHHHHGPSEGYVETPEEEECCRWLKQVDTVCVCDLLVRLPPFMTRPAHEYKVIVDETCEVNFDCGSKF